jgi:predicted ArsR family transcriptional regulator
VGEDDLPAAVKALINDCIDSVEQLEILLLLHKGRGRRFSAADVCAELRTNGDSTRERLDELVSRGLAVAGDDDGRRVYQLVPDRDRERAVAAVAEAYDARRVSVITFVVTKPVDRIRSFADAFRLRRDVDG